jgi:hypothetical protein
MMKTIETKTTILPPIKHVRVVCKVDLRKKDKLRIANAELVDQVCEKLKEEFNKNRDASFIFDDQLEGGIALITTVVACSVGSRWGRMCCGELGAGWVVLHVQWHLENEDGMKLTEPKTEKVRDSGVIGFEDLCDADFGPHTVKFELSKRAAKTISAEAKSAILRMQ